PILRYNLPITGALPVPFSICRTPSSNVFPPPYVFNAHSSYINWSKAIPELWIFGEDMNDVLLPRHNAACMKFSNTTGLYTTVLSTVSYLVATYPQARNPWQYATVHHMRGEAGTVFAAHYRDGIGLLDLSGSMSGDGPPTTLGSFDTTVDDQVAKDD